MVLNACDYKHLNCNCCVINCNEVDVTVNVKLPQNLSDYRLYDLLDISSCIVKTVSFQGIDCTPKNIWIDIPWRNLSRIAGQHVYKLSFMHRKENKYITLYFAYIIQDNNPAKPFMYMHDKYQRDDYDKYGLYLS